MQCMNHSELRPSKGRRQACERVSEGSWCTGITLLLSGSIHSLSAGLEGRPRLLLLEG